MDEQLSEQLPINQLINWWTNCFSCSCISKYKYVRSITRLSHQLFKPKPWFHYLRYRKQKYDTSACWANHIGIFCILIRCNWPWNTATNIACISLVICSVVFTGFIPFYCFNHSWKHSFSNISGLSPSASSVEVNLAYFISSILSFWVCLVCLLPKVWPKLVACFCPSHPQGHIIIAVALGTPSFSLDLALK